LDVAAPEVSVIIPCFDAAGTIERALESVLVERGVSLECVVVDDGSTDGTAAIVEAFVGRDPRVVLIRSPSNAGASAARNRALDAARGSWLTFLDADDVLLPGAVAALVGPTRTTDALAVIGQRTWTDGRRTWVSNLYDIPDIRRPGRKSLVSAPGLMYYASATGKLLHRSLTGDLRFEGRVLGDQPWTLRALLRAGDRIEVIGDIVYAWTRQARNAEPGGITATTRSSGRGSADAVRVAISAYRDVCAEADRTVDDPAAREVIAAGYLERLLRSDIGPFLANAVARRDPALPELKDAVRAFLDSVPADLLLRSRGLGAVFRPQVDEWPRLSASSRRTWWSSLLPAVRANRAVAGQLGGPLVAIAVRLVAVRDTAVTRALAEMLFIGVAVARPRARALRNGIRSSAAGLGLR
jgi:glycosyl transferase family 2